MISRNRNQELSAAIRSHQWHSPAGVRILEGELQPPPQKDLGELELGLGQELWTAHGHQRRRSGVGPPRARGARTDEQLE